jgi:hypothetical protein
MILFYSLCLCTCMNTCEVKQVHNWLSSNRMNIHYYIHTVSKTYLHYTSYAKNIIHYVFDDDMKIKVRTVYYDITMGSYRGKIRLIECNVKCHFLKNVPLKVLCGRCYICLRPHPLLYPPLHMYMFSNSSLQSLVHKFESNESQYTFISWPDEWFW